MYLHYQMYQDILFSNPYNSLLLFDRKHHSDKYQREPPGHSVPCRKLDIVPHNHCNIFLISDSWHHSNNYQRGPPHHSVPYRKLDIVLQNHCNSFLHLYSWHHNHNQRGPYHHSVPYRNNFWHKTVYIQVCHSSSDKYLRPNQNHLQFILLKSYK